MFLHLWMNLLELFDRINARLDRFDDWLETLLRKIPIIKSIMKRLDTTPEEGP